MKPMFMCIDHDSPPVTCEVPDDVATLQCIGVGSRLDHLEIVAIDWADRSFRVRGGSPRPFPQRYLTNTDGPMPHYLIEWCGGVEVARYEWTKR